MVVVVAHQHDDAAHALVQRWRERRGGACLLVPRDLSRPGWSHHVGPKNNQGRGDDFAVVDGGERLRTRAIRGVLTRVAAVQPDELGHIVPGDREYVASEMNALLVAWLAGLSCPVLNRPAPPSLAGPNLGHAAWLRLAARCGARVTSSRYETTPGTPVAAMVSARAAIEIAVVGGRCYPRGDGVAAALGEQAVRLAERAGVEVLTAGFDGLDADAAFVGANLYADVDRDDVAEALWTRLGAGAPA